VRAARGKRVETNTIKRLSQVPEVLEPARSINPHRRIYELPPNFNKLLAPVSRTAARIMLI
jgi:hypothetical protein